MNRSKSRVTRKKVIPKHFQKSQTSLSQILTTASYKKRIKELQKNNKVLAVALQDTRIDLAHCTSMLQRCANEDAKILHAKAKVKNMVTCIQTLVTDLNEVMSCLDPKPISLFNSSPDQVRLKISRPDLDSIEESNEDCEKNLSDVDMSNVVPLEQGSIPDNSPAQFLDAQKVSDSNAAVEDRVITGTPTSSVPPVSSPGSPLTPVLEISQSDEYYRNLLNLNIKCFPPKKVIKNNEVNTTSPLNGSKSLSRIPVRNKNPLPIQQPVEFSPPASKPNRKTFIVQKNTNQSPGMTETSDKQNSSLDVNHRHRRETYKISAMPETASPEGIEPQSGTIEVTDANIHCSEDMELTSIIPIHKISPIKSILTASNALPFSKEPLPIVSEQENVTTASNNNTSKFKCTDINQDMEFTCVIPMHVVPLAANDPIQDFKFASTCANDHQLNINACKSTENITGEPSKSTSKLASNKQDSTNKSVISGQEKSAIVSEDDSPTFKCSDPEDSKIMKDSLKRRSSVSSKIKKGKISDSKATLNRKKQSSVNSKDTTSPKSKISMDLSTVSPNELGLVSKSPRKTIVKKRKTVTFSEYLSESDIDDETLRKECEAVESKIACSSNLFNMSPQANGSNSFVDYDSNSDYNSKDDFSSFGRCNLKAPKKTSKKRHFAFERKGKSSKVQSEKDNKKKSVQAIDGVDMDDSLSLDFGEGYLISNSSESSSSLVKSSKVSNKNKSTKNCKLSEQLKSSDKKTAIDAVFVSQTNKESPNEKTPKVSSTENFKNVEVESASVLNTVTLLTGESSACNTILNYKKSFQSVIDECYDAFQNIETKKQIINEHKSNSKVTGQNKDPRPLPVPGLSESDQGVVKKRLPSQKKQSRRLSCISNSVDDIKNLPKPSQTGPTKLDDLLASLDSTINEDNRCNSKDGTGNHDLVAESVSTEQGKRPFSGVSERTSKKRATGYSSDVFNEIEAMCPQEIIPSCLGTIQQNIKAVDNSCEETEVYNLQDVLKAKAPETELEQSHSPQNKRQNIELKVRENNSNKNMKDNIQLIQDDIVRSDKSKSSIRADYMVHPKANDKSVKIDKSKTKNKNLEVDILAIRKTPLKNIQLTSTEASSLNEINTFENKIDKPKSNRKKSQKEKKTKSKETSSSHKSTRIKKSHDTLNDQNVQPLPILEPLPICATDEDNSFASAKNSTSLGSDRPRRTRPAISLKEPSLNSKMRR